MKDITVEEGVDKEVKLEAEFSVKNPRTVKWQKVGVWPCFYDFLYFKERDFYILLVRTKFWLKDGFVTMCLQICLQYSEIQKHNTL